MTLYSDAIPRAEEYIKRRNLSIEKQLGGGTQGVIFSTNKGTAIKALMHSECFERERNVYIRLKECDIDSIEGFWVPKLIDYHDELLIVEMQIVTPPYVLDFASAYLDETPPYAEDEEIMAYWENEKIEQFEDRWPVVKQIISEFRALGIHLSDVKPGNIEFEKQHPTN